MPEKIILIAGAPAENYDGLEAFVESIFSGYDVWVADSGLEIYEMLLKKYKSSRHLMKDFSPLKGIVGDFDSVESGLVDEYRNKGVEILEFDADKDKSDTELAIDAILRRYYPRILKDGMKPNEKDTEDLIGEYPLILLNAHGGRIDHELINILLLAKYCGIVRMIVPSGTLFGLIPGRNITIKVSSGVLISLIPLGVCNEVSLKGAKYTLNSRDLFPSSLTLSNVAEGNLSISYKTGFLILYVNDVIW